MGPPFFSHSLTLSLLVRAEAVLRGHGRFLGSPLSLLHLRRAQGEPRVESVPCACGRFVCAYLGCAPLMCSVGHTEHEEGGWRRMRDRPFPPPISHTSFSPLLHPLLPPLSLPPSGPPSLCAACLVQPLTPSLLQNPTLSLSHDRACLNKVSFLSVWRVTWPLAQALFLMSTEGSANGLGGEEHAAGG